MGKLGLFLMGRAMLSKSLIQFSVDGQGCGPSLLFDLRANTGGGSEDNGDFLKRSVHALPHSVPPTLQAHCQPTPLPETLGHIWASRGQSLVGSLLLSPGSCCAQGFVCALQESVFPVLCKFWQLYSGVNGELLQEGLYHTQVCCTQSPCFSSRPLLICTSIGDTQTLKGRSGSASVGPYGMHKVLFDPWSIFGVYGV